MRLCCFLVTLVLLEFLFSIAHGCSLVLGKVSVLQCLFFCIAYFSPHLVIWCVRVLSFFKLCLMKHLWWSPWRFPWIVEQDKVGKKVAGAPGMHSGVYEVGALFLLPNSKKKYFRKIFFEGI